MKPFFLPFACLLLLTACSSLSIQKQAGTNLAHFKKIYIEHRLADGRGVDQFIARELQRLGYDASSGPLTMAPEGVEVVVGILHDAEQEWGASKLKDDTRGGTVEEVRHERLPLHC